MRLVLTLFASSAYIPVHAQAGDGETELTEARRLYAEGRRAAEEHRWQDARAAWQASYALVPKTLVLVSLAGAEAQTGRLLAAIDSYQRFLHEAGSETPAFEADVQTQLTALEARLAHLRVRDVPSEAHATLDGAPLSSALLAVEFAQDPGQHTLEIDAPRRAVWKQVFTLGEGEHAELRWQAALLEPAKPTLSSPLLSSADHEAITRAALAAPLETAPHPPAAVSHRRRRALWISVAAVGLSALAAGLAVSLTSSKRGDSTHWDGPTIGTPGEPKASLSTAR